MIVKIITNLYYAVNWKLRFGNKIKLGFPLGLMKTRVEKDKSARIVLGERIQNRGNLFLGCKQNGSLTIGGHCFFNTNCSVTCMQNINIGSYCKFGNNLVIVDHDHNFKDASGRKEEFIKKDIVIGDRVWVGANCVILKGAEIGAGAVIAAGSVVRGKVAPGSVYYPSS